MKSDHERSADHPGDAPASGNPSIIIEMRNVSLSSMRNLDREVATGVDWIVKDADFWTIAGLQGSGKSDFMMLTAGLMPPRSGEYRLFGHRMPMFDEQHLRERLRVGLVFENGQLFNQLTVRENVALPLRYHHNLEEREAAAEIDPLLDTLELMPWAERNAGSLPRNWQRRVGLARALVLKPRLLLADNVLAGLDLRDSYWWLTFLAKLRQGHPLIREAPMTIVVTAAELRPWQGRANNFAVLRDRRFTVLGTWDQVQAANQDLLRELLTSRLEA